jgi:hypothetical protein
MAWLWDALRLAGRIIWAGGGILLLALIVNVLLEGFSDQPPER